MSALNKTRMTVFALSEDRDEVLDALEFYGSARCPFLSWTQNYESYENCNRGDHPKTES